jgi:hypothetical protein
MYPIGQQHPNPNNNYQDMNLPDKTITHTKTVKDLQSTDKVFNSNGGLKRKWIVQFTDGYHAELCPRDGEVPSAFLKGCTVSFRIGYRKPGFDDEIEAVNPEQNPFPRVVSMSGHPAAIALRAVIDAKLPSVNDLESLLKEAEVVLAWLLKQTE